MENRQQEQQQQQGNEGFVERFLAKFGFRNDNIEEEKSVHDNEKEIKGNLKEMELESDKKRDETSLNSITKMGESSTEIVSLTIPENDYEEVVALKNLTNEETVNNSNISLPLLPRNNSVNDLDYLSKQLRGLINYLYDQPNLTFLTGGNYQRKQEERLKSDLEELQILYREIDATKSAISRLNKNKTAVRTEKRLVRNNLERLRSEAMVIMEKMVSTNEPELFKKWETLRKSENIEELNNFLSEIKTKEMTAETMARLVRRRIFQIRAASIINDDCSQNFQITKPSKLKQPMANTVSTSPIGSQTGTKRSNAITNIRRKRISVNASGSSSINSGIRLRPMIGREKTTIQITPTNSIQNPNQRPSNNSMFVAVSNSSHSSITQIGPQLPPKPRIIRPKPPIPPPPPPIIRTRHIRPIFENDLLSSPNSNTSQSVSEATSSLYLTSSSTFQTEIKTVLKTLFGKEAADAILQEDEVNDTSTNNNQVTIHNIEFDDLHHEENEEDNP